MSTEKKVLVKKMFANGLLGAWAENILQGGETHWLSGKENVPGAVVSK